jgi:hypothetical protein
MPLCALFKGGTNTGRRSLWRERAIENLSILMIDARYEKVRRGGEVDQSGRADCGGHKRRRMAGGAGRVGGETRKAKRVGAKC